MRSRQATPSWALQEAGTFFACDRFPLYRLFATKNGPAGYAGATCLCKNNDYQRGMGRKATVAMGGRARKPAWGRQAGRAA